MSQAEQDAVAIRLIRERKNLQQQIAAIEPELYRIREVLEGLASKLKSDLDRLSRNFSPETFKEAVATLPELLDKYSKAKEEITVKTEQLKKMGLD